MFRRDPHLEKAKEIKRAVAQSRSLHVVHEAYLCKSCFRNAIYQHFNKPSRHTDRRTDRRMDGRADRPVTLMMRVQEGTVMLKRFLWERVQPEDDDDDDEE